MTIKAHFLSALVAFVASVTGSDLIARMTIAGDSFDVALAGHLDWASSVGVWLLYLFAPFAGVAFICGAANRRARTRSTVALFLVVSAVLAYFYFDGFQVSQRYALNKGWTAATLAVGVLPLSIGLPLLVAAALAAVALVRFDSRSPIPS